MYIVWPVVDSSFLHSFIVVWTHRRQGASSLCLSKARVPGTLFPLHRHSNQMSFKWNSVRVTDKIFFFFFYNRHTRYHYISSWDNCSLAKCVIFQRVIPTRLWIFHVQHQLLQPESNQLCYWQCFNYNTEKIQGNKDKSIVWLSGICVCLRKLCRVDSSTGHLHVLLILKIPAASLGLPEMKKITFIEMMVSGSTMNEMQSS